MSLALIPAGRSVKTYDRSKSFMLSKTVSSLSDIRYTVCPFDLIIVAALPNGANASI